MSGRVPKRECRYRSPGKLLLADGLTAKDVEVSLELPEQYLLGDDPAVYAVYTIRGGTKQESTSVKVPAKISGMADLLAQSTGAQLASSGDVAPGRSAQRRICAMS